MTICISVIVLLVVVKVIWVLCATNEIGSFESEKKGIIRRANYLTSKVATTPQKLLDEMPSGIGEQFQGEWAIYSCSMTCAALANIAILYPKNKEISIRYIGEIIDIALSEDIKEYDRMRWGEDPMDGIYGNRSHISYYSHSLQGDEQKNLPKPYFQCTNLSRGIYLHTRYACSNCCHVKLCPSVRWEIPVNGR